MNRNARGVTLIELMIVITVIMFLAGALYFGMRKISLAAKERRTKATLETLKNGLSTYQLTFRTLFNTTFARPTSGTLTEDQVEQNNSELVYHINTPFRVNPDPTRNEAQASVDVGPFITFGEGDLKTLNGRKVVIDAFGSPIFFACSKKQFVDSTDAKNKFTLPVPTVYSFGRNKIDDAGDPASDDILFGN